MYLQIPRMTLRTRPKEVSENAEGHAEGCSPLSERAPGMAWQS